MIGTTTKTTLRLRVDLHQAITLKAKNKKKSFAQLVSELLERALEQDEQIRIKKAYQDLKELRGICKDNIPDASSTINELLYGENGVWKGERE